MIHPQPFVFRALDALETAHDEKSFVEAGQVLADELGYTWFSYLSISGHGVELLASYPKAWKVRYETNEYYAIDPVVHCAKRRLDAFVWDAKERLAKGEAYVTEANSFGIRSGLTIPIWGGFGRFDSITLAGRTKKNPDSVQELSDLCRAQLLGFYYHVRFHTRLKTENAPTHETLTLREKQCLSWAAQGKTLADTAVILGVSERTITFHIVNARRKLAAHSLTHAVSKAITLGLIKI